MQQTLDGKPLTKLMRLEQLRMQYYKEFVEDIRTHEILLRQKCISYLNTIRDLDKEIKNEQRRTKNV